MLNDWAENRTSTTALVGTLFVSGAFAVFTAIVLVCALVLVVACLPVIIFLLLAENSESL